MILAVELGKKIGRFTLPWLRRLFLVVASTYLAYLVVFNALFWTGGFEALINRSQDEVRVHFRHAYTVRPFVLHAREVQVVVNEAAVQMDIQVDEVRVAFHATPFLDRIVHMSGVRGGAFSFRFRHRIDPGALTPAHLAAVPPISGVEEPPIILPDPHPDYDLSNNWNVRMDDIDARFREIWMNAQRFVGRARVTGGFYLRTEDSLIIPKSTLEVDHGVVFIAHRPLAADMNGQIIVALSKIDFQKGSGDDALEALVVESDLEVFLIELGAFRHHLPESVVTHGGLGTMRLKGAMVAGLIEEGARFALDVDGLVVQSGPLHLSTPIDLEVTSDGERLEGALELGGAIGLGPGVPTMILSQARLTGGARAANVREKVTDPRGKLDLQGGTRRFQIEGGEKDPRVTRGVARLSTQLELGDGGAISGAAGLRFENAAFVWGEAGIFGEAELRLFVRGTAGDGPLRLDNAEGEIVVDADVADDDDRWKARVAITEAQGSSRKGRLAVGVKLETLGPFMAIPPVDEAVPGVAEALLDTEDAEARLTLDWDEERMILTLARLEFDGGSAAGHWRLGDGPVRGALMVQATPVRIGVVMGPEGAETTMFPGDDWEKKHFRAAPGEKPWRPRSAGKAE